jgi:hypothetical protein
VLGPAPTQLPPFHLATIPLNPTNNQEPLNAAVSFNFAAKIYAPSGTLINLLAGGSGQTGPQASVTCNATLSGQLINN